MKRVAFIACIVLCFYVTDVPASGPSRIVSLAPQITEILYAMGLEEKIAAVTSVCDYPPRVKEKPRVGGMSNPSLEAVISIRPDLVVMTMDGNPKEFQEKLSALGIRTYVFTAKRISELPQGIRGLGKEIGETESAERLAGQIERELREIRSRLKKRSIPWRGLFVVWPEPLIVAGPGTAIDDTIALLGGLNVVYGTNLSYPKYSIEEVLRQSPDVIFIGKGMGALKELSQGLVEKLEMVPAVKNGQVCFVQDYLYRLGPRIIDGIKEIESCLDRN